MAGILGQADITELEEDPDPVAVASGKITDLLYQCAHGPAQTPPPIYSTLDNNIKGLNIDLGSCQRILSKLPCTIPVSDSRIPSITTQSMHEAFEKMAF